MNKKGFSSRSGTPLLPEFNVFMVLTISSSELYNMICISDLKKRSLNVTCLHLLGKKNSVGIIYGLEIIVKFTCGE